MRNKTWQRGRGGSNSAGEATDTHSGSRKAGGKQTSRKARRQEGKQAGRKAGRKASKQEGKQAERQLAGTLPPEPTMPAELYG